MEEAYEDIYLQRIAELCAGAEKRVADLKVEVAHLKAAFELCHQENVHLNELLGARGVVLEPDETIAKEGDHHADEHPGDELAAPRRG